MTRLWLPFGRRVLVLVTILAALVVLFPLRLAIDALGLAGEGFSARAVAGPVWSGKIAGLRAADIELGTVDAALSPLGLLVGEARIAIARSDGAAGEGPLAGTFVISRNALGIERADAVLATAGALAPLPVGAVTTRGLSVRFEDGACVVAEGSVQAQLTASFGGVVLAQGLSGNATCDGRYVRFLMAGGAGRERIDLRLAATGDYVAELFAADPAPDRLPALTAAGFAAAPGGYRLRITGRF